MLDIQYGQATDSGKIRTNNEDAVGAFLPISRHQARSHGYLFAIADGVGGLDLGEVASSTAITVLIEEFAQAQAGSMHVSLLPRLIQHANAAVHDCTLAAEYRGRRMATTIAACAIRYDQAVISHVGDSRCYLVRNNEIRQITQDHTWISEQEKLGLITTKGFVDSDNRHILTRSLGPELFVSIDTTVLTLHAGDILVLTTDGVHDETRAEEIARIVSTIEDAETLARNLVAFAIERDGGDNTTAQIIRIRSVERVGLYRGRLIVFLGKSHLASGGCINPIK